MSAAVEVFAPAYEGDPEPVAVAPKPSLAAVPDEATGPDVDRDAVLTELYTAHYRKLVRLAMMLLDDVGRAEEVVQDAYVKMHRSWRRIREPKAAEAYLRVTVVNLARSRLRRRLVAQKHAPKPMPDAPSAEYGALEILERERVTSVLRSLPQRQRECLMLRYYADLTETQIAATLGITAGAVKTHCFRGMATMRARLREPAPGSV
jgi:RNA polymerase sigma-70 factor (sigma-E family)